MKTSIKSSPLKKKSKCRYYQNIERKKKKEFTRVKPRIKTKQRKKKKRQKNINLNFLFRQYHKKIEINVKM